MRVSIRDHEGQCERSCGSVSEVMRVRGHAGQRS